MERKWHDRFNEYVKTLRAGEQQSREQRSWVHYQRSLYEAGKLSPLHQMRFREEGIDLSLDEAWQRAMESCAEALEASGGGDCGPTGGLSVGQMRWIDNQRRAHRAGRLSASRVQRLHAAGIGHVLVGAPPGLAHTKVQVLREFQQKLAVLRKQQAAREAAERAEDDARRAAAEEEHEQLLGEPRVKGARVRWRLRGGRAAQGAGAGAGAAGPAAQPEEAPSLWGTAAGERLGRRAPREGLGARGTTDRRRRAVVLCAEDNTVHCRYL